MYICARRVPIATNRSFFALSNHAFLANVLKFVCIIT